MTYCSQCEAPIPDGQRICSMCMGDMDHGNDGYYREWAEDQCRAEQEQRDAEEQQREELRTER